MTVASDWLRAKMVVVSSTRELRPLMKIYTKEITSKKIIGMTPWQRRTGNKIFRFLGDVRAVRSC